MRNLKFTNKEEYLQYRKDWKEEYKQLSETIRDYKWMRKEWSRACNIAQSKVKKESNYYDHVGEILKQSPRYVHLKEKYKNDRKWLEQYQTQATEMLTELKLAKQEAQRQYLVAKQQKVELVTA